MLHSMHFMMTWLGINCEEKKVSTNAKVFIIFNDGYQQDDTEVDR